MRVSSSQKSKPFLLALGLVLSITAATVFAKSDHHHQQPQPQHQHQQPPQQQQSSDVENGNGDFVLDELNVNEDGVVVTGGEGVVNDLHKMIGVDYNLDGGSRIDYTHVQQQSDFAIPSDESDVGLKVEHQHQSQHAQQQAKKQTKMHGDTIVSNTCLLFSDEFDSLDNSVWRHDITLTGGGNFEVQAYLNNRTNTFVQDGIFYIRPTLTEYRIGAEALQQGGVLDLWGNDPGTQFAGAGGNILNPIQSGLVRPVNNFKFRYGKVEVRAKMPKGKWIWPEESNQRGWPVSGEIDLVEFRGNGPEYPAGGYDKMASTLHWGPSYEFSRFQMTHAEYGLPAGKTFADEFHIFVDGNLLLNVTFDNMFAKGQFPAWVENLWSNSNAAPFDQEFYLTMNVAVADTAGYFPDGVGGKPWSDRSEHAVNEFYAAKADWYPTWSPENGLDRAMAADYVRVYKHDCQN
ncbi:hypothetical protein BGX23_004226 [Mortierella sp. AD031]|nr:hypothetical protein BGX23_004226 [Mortierella sp. AD031]